MNDHLVVASLALKKALENDEAVRRYIKLCQVRAEEERARRANPFVKAIEGGNR
jgi:hypothetical protein